MSQNAIKCLYISGNFRLDFCHQTVYFKLPFDKNPIIRYAFRPRTYTHYIIYYLIIIYRLIYSVVPQTVYSLYRLVYNYNQ